MCSIVVGLFRHGFGVLSDAFDDAFDGTDAAPAATIVCGDPFGL